jgi:hypothetical protein
MDNKPIRLELFNNTNDQLVYSFPEESTTNMTGDFNSNYPFTNMIGEFYIVAKFDITDKYNNSTAKSNSFNVSKLNPTVLVSGQLLDYMVDYSLNITALFKSSTSDRVLNNTPITYTIIDTINNVAVDTNNTMTDNLGNVFINQSNLSAGEYKIQYSFPGNELFNPLNYTGYPFVVHNRSDIGISFSGKSNYLIGDTSSVNIAFKDLLDNISFVNTDIDLDLYINGSSNSTWRSNTGPNGLINWNNYTFDSTGEYRLFVTYPGNDTVNPQEEEFNLSVLGDEVLGPYNVTDCGRGVFYRIHLNNTISNVFDYSKVYNFTQFPAYDGAWTYFYDRSKYAVTSRENNNLSVAWSVPAGKVGDIIIYFNK